MTKKTVFLGVGYAGQTATPLLAKGYQQLIKNNGWDAILSDDPESPPRTTPQTVLISVAKQRDSVDDDTHFVWVSSYADADITAVANNKTNHDSCLIVDIHLGFPLLDVLRYRAQQKLQPVVPIEVLDTTQQASILKALLDLPTWYGDQPPVPGLPAETLTETPPIDVTTTTDTATDTTDSASQQGSPLVLKNSEDTATDMTADFSLPGFTENHSQSVSRINLSKVAELLNMPLEKTFIKEKNLSDTPSIIPDPFAEPLQQIYIEAQKFMKLFRHDDQLLLKFTYAMIICHRCRETGWEITPFYGEIIHCIPQNSYLYPMRILTLALWLEARAPDTPDFAQHELLSLLSGLDDFESRLSSTAAISGWRKRKPLCCAVVLCAFVTAGTGRWNINKQQADLLKIASRMTDDEIDALGIRTFLAVGAAKKNLDDIL